MISDLWVMSTFRQVLRALAFAAAGLATIACEPPTGSGTGANTTDEPSPGTVPVTFTIDDSANQVYVDSDGLAWKGSFSYDSATRLLSHDPAWGGPYPMLNDDGTNGDATAGDHIWSVTVHADLPDNGDLTYGYGAIRNSVNGGDGDWIWTGANGAFTVAAGDTTPIEAAGLTLPPFGTVDLRITLDVTSLPSPFDGSPPNTVEVKSSAWGWYLKPLHDDGTLGDDVANDDTYTMQFSLDRARLEGLVELDEDVQFMLVLDGVEYRDGAPLSAGVDALTDWAGAGTFTTESLSVDAGTNSLELVVGGADELPNLFFSEYVEGSNYDRALEVFNASPGGGSADLTKVAINVYANGSTTPTATINPDSGTLDAGSVFVVANLFATFESSADYGTSTLIIDGNDVVELTYDGVPLDVIGQIGSGATFGADVTLRRDCVVVAGDPDGTDAFDPDTEFTSFPADTTDGLGERGCP